MNKTTRNGAEKPAAEGFTGHERAAMKERQQELKAERRSSGAGKAKASGESDVLAKIAEMPEPDRIMAELLHKLIKKVAPALSPKTWYGMPAYAREGKVICFFQSAAKFKARYATLGFSDQAQLDEGSLWATSFALTQMSPAVEAKITALVKRAAG